MFNLLASLIFVLTAVYQDVVKHNETGFVHFMLWTIACMLAFLVSEKLHEKGK